MKLLRYGDPGAERPGILDAQGHLRDLSDIVDDIDATTISPAGLAKLAEIDPATLLATHRAARTAGLRIAGWYHSHPNGRAEPSATDAARAVPDGRVWMIVAGGTVAAWRAVTGGAVHDRFDPLILVAA